MKPEWGVSFSVKYAKELSIDPKQCLNSALKDLRFKNLRLMSYWDLHEPLQGKYDFTELDWQFELAKKYGTKISLAIGLRQPRWPESHWPDWAKELSKVEWNGALLKYIEAVVNRYKDHTYLESWQLENEARLKQFGLNGDFDRKRLIKEFKLVKSLDNEHPIVMTLSDSWGLPIKRPKPDLYGLSIYRNFYDRGKYRHSRRSPTFYKSRAKFIKFLTSKNVFIHELQAEPWGPKAVNQMSLDEQSKTMNINKIKENVALAKKTKISPIYLWGLEWWYLLKVEYNKPQIWQNAQKIITDKIIS